MNVAQKDEDLGCCHLVTATCKALDISSRIYHRTVYIIRHLRNVAERMSSENCELTQAYYRYASNMVEKIDEDENSLSVYTKMWNDYIQPCVKATLKRDYETAWKLYVGMCYRVSRKYEVTLPVSVFREAELVLAT